MIKFFILVNIVLALIRLKSVEGKRRILDVINEVNLINNMSDLPWQADTYGQKQIDLKLFSNSKLGTFIETEGLVQGLPKQFGQKFKVPLLRADGIRLPTNFTWANAKITNCSVRHIRDQSNCGSCWAIATTATLGDRFCIQSGGKIKATFSQQFVITCSSKNHGCNGGYMDHVNDFLVSDGTITGGDYGSRDGCQMYTIKPCGFPPGSEASCSHNSGRTPRCMGRLCNNVWYRYRYEPNTNVFKGVYVPTSNAEALSGHAVRIVGWGIENGVKYWHVANSWGTSWGEAGFFKILRGTNVLKIENSVIAYKPKL